MTCSVPDTSILELNVYLELTNEKPTFDFNADVRFVLAKRLQLPNGP